MDMFWIALAGIWPLIGYFGAGTGIVIGCIALYIFTPAPVAAMFPNIKKTLLWVVGLTVAVMITLGIGVNLGEKRVRAQCEAEKSLAIEGAKRARAKAQRDITRKPSRWMPNNAKRDPDCRDC